MGGSIYDVEMQNVHSGSVLKRLESPQIPPEDSRVATANPTERRKYEFKGRHIQMMALGTSFINS